MNILIVAVIILAIMSIVFVCACLSCDEGWEDEEGFHYGKK